MCFSGGGGRLDYRTCSFFIIRGGMVGEVITVCSKDEKSIGGQGTRNWELIVICVRLHICNDSVFHRFFCDFFFP